MEKRENDKEIFTRINRVFRRMKWPDKWPGELLMKVDEGFVVRIPTSTGNRDVFLSPEDQLPPPLLESSPQREQDIRRLWQFFRG